MIATRLAMATGADVITEGGFGFDLGGEKFLDIACRSAGIWPRAVVLVVTLRALRLHGGAALADAGTPNRAALIAGLPQLERHLFSVGAFGLPPVVALNRFPDDEEDEVAVLAGWCATHGVPMAPCSGFAEGGVGAEELADLVSGVLDSTDASPPQPWHPYAADEPYADKISAVARHVYGADGIEIAPAAARELERITAAVGTGLPVCIAKTHLSLSDDPKRRGVPHGFTVNVREARLAAGAGFVVASTGSIVTMPGLPHDPAALHIRVRPDGSIAGLMSGDRD
jgi:formate--tetrahydrofolate ligase